MCGSGHIILEVQALARGQSINLNSALSLGYCCLNGTALIFFNKFYFTYFDMLFSFIKINIVKKKKNTHQTYLFMNTSTIKMHMDIILTTAYHIYSNKCLLSNNHPVTFYESKLARFHQNWPRAPKFLLHCPNSIARASILGLKHCNALMV